VLVDEADEMSMVLNLDVAERIGIDVPPGVVSQADTVIENGDVRE
jgi:hypothetical protein